MQKDWWKEISFVNIFTDSNYALIFRFLAAKSWDFKYSDAMCLVCALVC